MRPGGAGRPRGPVSCWMPRQGEPAPACGPGLPTGLPTGLSPEAAFGLSLAPSGWSLSRIGHSSRGEGRGARGEGEGRGARAVWQCGLAAVVDVVAALLGRILAFAPFGCVQIGGRVGPDGRPSRGSPRVVEDYGYVIRCSPIRPRRRPRVSRPHPSSYGSRASRPSGCREVHGLHRFRSDG